MRLPTARTFAVAAAAVCLAATTGCGTSAQPEVSAAAKACRAQWADVAQGILDMDGDPTPSSLAERWSTIIAGVDYQRHNATGKDCAAQVESQQQAISALERLSQRLRIYDMEFQLRTIRPQAELYLEQPVPKLAGPKDSAAVKPPSHREVRRALALLEANATLANDQLKPAWEQATAIDLTSSDAIRKAVADVDRLAQSSPAFATAEQALQVLVAATGAGEQ